MFIHKPRCAPAVMLAAVGLCGGVCSLAFQSRAAPPDRKPDPPTADDQGDTKPTTLRTWDSDRDLPPPVASDRTVTFDYPIVYVRVPRPYPKEYLGINHLN